MRCIFEVGLKRNPLFSFSRKAKIGENSLIFAKFRFCENFRFREGCSEICCFHESFRENFLFPGWFPLVFRIWIHIQVAPESGSALQMENFRENFRKTEHFRKHFRENGNFRTFS
jgi:hypothetical protein